MENKRLGFRFSSDGDPIAEWRRHPVKEGRKTPPGAGGVGFGL